MVMSNMDQFHISHLEDENSPYSLIRYGGDFAEGNVAKYLRERSNEFDVVLMFGISRYDQAREEVNQSFNGPKILIMEGLRDLKGNYIQIDIIDLLPSKLEEITKQL